jgi:hypothetical protein
MKGNRSLLFLSLTSLRVLQSTKLQSKDMGMPSPLLDLFAECSVKKNLKEALKSAPPKEAIDKVMTSMGGLMQATSAGQLPLSTQQAYNLKHSMKPKDVPGPSRGKGRDLLYSVMEQCKAAQKGDQFVQEVTCAPEPMAVLATNQQLLDLTRFCCNPLDFGIMGIDPTFNLGEFSVTPIVYQHLMVRDRRTGKSPWMLGPIFVHYRKVFRNYNLFLSSLVGLQRELAGIKAIGTDGERALIEACMHQFKEAIFLRCFRHLQKNIERKLQAEDFPVASQKLYIVDIFGRTDQDGAHYAGLVDCHTENEFQVQLEAMKNVWDRREKDIFGENHKPSFHTWFVRNKASDFCEGALRDVQELAGLGSPPLPYYTNPNESINSTLKKKVNFTKQQWPTFNNLMKEFVSQQKREVEKAIVGGGKFELRTEYESHGIFEAGKWWKMSEEQKKLHLHKFHTCTVSNPVSQSAIVAAGMLRKGKEKKAHAAYKPSDQNKSLTTNLAVTVDNALTMLDMPQETIEGLWNKATRLINDAQALSNVPGGDPLDCFVLSTSNCQPHMVRCKSHPETAEYKCDDHCIHFKSLGLCSHTVAASHSNGDLARFLKHFNLSKGSPNLFQMAKHGMPQGAGKKGGRLPRKKTKAVIPLTTTVVPTTTVTVEVPERHQQEPVSPSFVSGPLTPTFPTQAPRMTRIPIPTSVTQGNVIAACPPPRLTTPTHPNQSVIHGATPPNILQPVFPSPPTPFKLVFLHGNISICSGCHQRFPRKTSGAFEDSPYNVVLQHF